VLAEEGIGHHAPHATRDVGAAREFVSELELALAERALRTAEGRGAFPKGDGDPTAVD
jgi:hypothetical protein